MSVPIWVSGGMRYALGPNQLQLVAPVDSSGLVAERLRMRGPLPIEVKLKGGGANPGLLDNKRAHGARIVLG